MNKEVYSWIKDHKVCFEMLPLKWFLDAKVQHIGFELTLYAQSIEQTVDSEDKRSYELYRGLEKIVTSAIAQVNPGCRCEILAFDFSFRHRPVTNFKKEIQLVVLLVNQENPFRPVDEFLANCSSKVQTQLTKIGVRVRVWQES
jgi:hypothetical protein